MKNIRDLNLQEIEEELLNLGEKKISCKANLCLAI